MEDREVPDSTCQSEWFLSKGVSFLRLLDSTQQTLALCPTVSVCAFFSATVVE